MTLERLIRIIQNKEVLTFLAELKNLDTTAINVNEKVTIINTEKVTTNTRDILKTTTQTKGLIHFLIDSDNVPMLEAFLNLPNVDQKLAYTCSTQIQITRDKHSIFQGTSTNKPLVQSPLEYAKINKRKTMLDVLKQYQSPTTVEEPAKRFRSG